MWLCGVEENGKRLWGEYPQPFYCSQLFPYLIVQCQKKENIWVLKGNEVRYFMTHKICKKPNGLYYNL